MLKPLSQSTASTFTVLLLNVIFTNTDIQSAQPNTNFLLNSGISCEESGDLAVLKEIRNQHHCDAPHYTLTDLVLLLGWRLNTLRLCQLVMTAAFTFWWRGKFLDCALFSAPQLWNQTLRLSKSLMYESLNWLHPKSKRQFHSFHFILNFLSSLK